MNISVATTTNSISVNETAVSVIVSDTANNITVSNVGIKGSDGFGVPAGGTTNMVLTKASNTNYDTQWVSILDDVNMNGGYF